MNKMFFVLLFFNFGCSSITKKQNAEVLSSAVMANSGEIVAVSRILAEPGCNFSLEGLTKMSQQYVDIGALIGRLDPGPYKQGAYFYLLEFNKMSVDKIAKGMTDSVEEGSRWIMQQKNKKIMENQHECINDIVAGYFIDIGMYYSMTFETSSSFEEGWMMACSDDKKDKDTCQKIFNLRLKANINEEYRRFEEQKRLRTELLKQSLRPY